MATETTEAETPFKYGDHGEIIDRATGEVIGYAPGHDPATSETKTFDAAGHMRKIRTRQGMQDYLDVKWRVAWLRAEHPAAKIVTKQIEGGEMHARFRCAITLPNGAKGVGHGSETQGDFPDFYEKAETKAIGRACAVLGYGTDAATDFDDGEPLDGRAAAKDERAVRHQEVRQQADKVNEQVQQNRQQAAPPTPLRSRTSAAIERLEHDREEGVIGAATVPLRDEAQARRMTAQAQGPRAPQPRTGVDPATIPGVVKGVQNAKPATKYEEVYDTYTKMDVVRQAMAEVGVTAGGQQNMNDCRVAVNQWVKARFPEHGGDAVVGTGNWNEQYGRNDLRPCDIANALYHWSSQLNAGGAAEAREAAGNDPDDGWGDQPSADDIPF